jgi:hypothetical protein
MALEHAMHVTQTRLPLDDLGVTMAQMRVWLDAHGITPLTFHSHDGRGGVVIEIAFSSSSEAQQFAGHFGAAVLVD